MTGVQTKGQLAGVRVLDLSRVLAGPLAGQMLADLGAEVIKLERPGSGDDARQYGPPFFQVPDSDAGQPGPVTPGPLESATFMAANRNKKSIAIDFTTAEGSALVAELADQADVIIENYRVDTLARHGLDYATLSQRNPGLIYCSVTGYGQTGPYRERPGYDAIFQAQGGLMHSIGFPDDHPSGGPMRCGFSIVDILASLYADIGILGALYKRDANGGTGEFIDMALLDCSIAALSHHSMYYLISGQLPPRRGNGGVGGGVPSGLFRCSEGELMMTIGNNRQFRSLCNVLECPELAADERFATAPERGRNREAVLDEVNRRFAKQTAGHWLERLLAADIPAGRVNNLAQVFADEQVVQRGMQVYTKHWSGADLPLVANPIRFSGEPIDRYVRPPRTGEHTTQILSQLLHIPADRIDALFDKGIVGGTR